MRLHRRDWFSGADTLRRLAQDAVQLSRDLALLRIQIGVARRHGEAVLFPDDLAAADFDREAEIFRQPPNDQELLIVLLAEDREIGHRCNQQFRNHGRHTAEKMGPEVSLETGAWSADLNSAGEALRIHLCDRWREDQIDHGLRQLLSIALERAGIAVEIFVRRELRRVHKNAGDGP